MVDFPGNSNVSRQPESKPSTDEPKAAAPEQKKVEKVVTGKVIQQKPSLGKRFKELFFAAGAQNVGEYMLFDVLIPAVRDTLVEVITGGIRKAAYGENRPAARARIGYDRPSGPGGFVSYNRMPPASSVSRYEPERPMGRRDRPDHFQRNILQYREEAEDVLDKMYSLLERYKQVTKSDYYDLLGLTSPYTDEAWGWLSLRGSQVVKVANGYLIDLPEPEPLPPTR